MAIPVSNNKPGDAPNAPNSFGSRRSSYSVPMHRQKMEHIFQLVSRRFARYRRHALGISSRAVNRAFSVDQHFQRTKLVLAFDSGTTPSPSSQGPIPDHLMVNEPLRGIGLCFILSSILALVALALLVWIAYSVKH